MFIEVDFPSRYKQVRELPDYATIDWRTPPRPAPVTVSSPRPSAGADILRPRDNRVRAFLTRLDMR
jgi:hypothetical protein